MQEGQRVRVKSDVPVFAGMEGVIHRIEELSELWPINVLLDELQNMKNVSTTPFADYEIEVI
jgi:hypothetical protein